MYTYVYIYIYIFNLLYYLWASAACVSCSSRSAQYACHYGLREDSSTGYGLRLSTEVYGSKREKRFSNEYLQEDLFCYCVIHAYIYVYTYIYVYILCVYIYIYIYEHIYIYIYTHTHIDITESPTPTPGPRGGLEGGGGLTNIQFV